LYTILPPDNAAVKSDFDLYEDQLNLTLAKSEHLEGLNKGFLACRGRYLKSLREGGTPHGLAFDVRIDQQVEEYLKQVERNHYEVEQCKALNLLARMT
ncbi:hypothetical protein PFISCL1PPCAC_7790, partial [Pristionchus fissidentatus]